MTTEPKEKAIKIYEVAGIGNDPHYPAKFSEEQFIGCQMVLLRDYEKALQEQAKEIKKKLGRRDVWGEYDIQIRMNKYVWKAFWEKYGVKEEGK